MLLGARRLVLLKSVEPPADIDLGEATRLGLVDTMFPIIASQLDIVEIASLREAEPRLRSFTTSRTRNETEPDRPRE